MYETNKTIRIKGLRRTGLYMGYYTFRGVNKDCYVHLFANGMHGIIGFDRTSPTEANVKEFKGIIQLKELMAQMPDRNN